VSGPSNVQELPITDKRQLVEFHAAGSKPREQWSIGTEHEKFGFRLDDLRPLTYDGASGIEAMHNCGWATLGETGAGKLRLSSYNLTVPGRAPDSPSARGVG